MMNGNQAFKGLFKYSFPTCVPDVYLVSEPKYCYPSPLLTYDSILFVKEIFLKTKNFPSRFLLQSILANRNNTRNFHVSQINTKTSPPDWKQKQTNKEFQKPLLVSEPHLLDISLTEHANLLADFSSSCSYRMDSYLRGLETLCKTINFGSHSSHERGAVGVPPLHSPHLHLILEPLHLKNYHLFVNKEPIPAHLLTLCLYAYHTFINRKESPIVYIPSLESWEEANYYSLLFSCIEESLNPPFPIRCVCSIDNIFAAINLEWITYELRKYINGVVLEEDLCYISWNEISENNILDKIEFSKQLQYHIQCICIKTNIKPLSSGNYCFGSSYKSSSIGLNNKNKIIHQIKENAEKGWYTNTLLNPELLSLFTKKYPTKIILSESDLPQNLTINFVNYLFSSNNYEKNNIIHYKEIEHDFLFLLQYLTLFLSGKSTFTYENYKTKQKFIANANIFEYHRRKIQLYIKYKFSIKLKTNEEKTFNSNIAIDLLSEVFHRICHGVGKINVERSLNTKIAYDDSYTLLCNFFLKIQKNEEHFSEKAYWHMITPFINNPARLQEFLLLEKYSFLKYSNVCIDGEIVFTTNESFAPANSLCKCNFPSFRPKSFGPEGQVFDGWETRRHNMFPPDYVIIKLKYPSKIYGVNIDTAHFSGNAAQGASIQGLIINLRHNRYQEEWIDLVENKVLNDNARNYFPTIHSPWVQYIRLNNYPDGGIARLHLFGEIMNKSIQEETKEIRDKLWHDKVKQYFSLVPKETGFPQDFIPPYSDISLLGKPDSSLPPSDSPPTILFPNLYDYGGSNASVIAGSNTQYSIPSNILRPGRGINMGDGWETSRMRLPDKKQIFNLETSVYKYCNWAVIQLNQKGSIHKIVVDTFHFKNNTPKAIAIEGTNHSNLTIDNYYDPSIRWCSILPPSGLEPHKEQLFEVPIGQQDKQWTYILVKIYPCGGLSRLRLYGPLNSKASL